MRDFICKLPEISGFINIIGETLPECSFSEGKGMQNQTMDAEWESGKLPESLHIWKELWGNQPKTQWYRKQPQIYSMGGLWLMEIKFPPKKEWSLEVGTFVSEIWSPTWGNQMFTLLGWLVFWPQKQEQTRLIIRVLCFNSFNSINTFVPVPTVAEVLAMNIHTRQSLSLFPWYIQQCRLQKSYTESMDRPVLWWWHKRYFLLLLSGANAPSCRRSCRYDAHKSCVPIQCLDIRIHMAFHLHV